MAGITQVDARILSSLLFLGGASVIELVSSILIIRKDHRAWPNRFFALAFFSLSIGLLVNTVYVMLDDPVLVTRLNSVSIFSAILGSFLLLSGTMVIQSGPSRELGNKIALILGAVVVISAIAAVLPGRWTEIDPVEGVSQFIYWNAIYTVYATLPVFLAVLPSLYIFIKLYRGLDEDERSYRRPFLLLITGTAGLLLSYPLLVLPHFLIFIVEDLRLMIMIGLIAGVGIVASSVVVFFGFFLRPS
ncbi:MAG: hypothetical protein ACFFD4_26450 [Candidatus Odinarchaeota archaeon]